MADLKPVYKAETIEEAEAALDDLEEKCLLSDASIACQVIGCQIPDCHQIMAQKMAQSVGLF